MGEKRIKLSLRREQMEDVLDALIDAAAAKEDVEILATMERADQEIIRELEEKRQRLVGLYMWFQKVVEEHEAE